MDIHSIIRTFLSVLFPKKTIIRWQTRDIRKLRSRLQGISENMSSDVIRRNGAALPAAFTSMREVMTALMEGRVKLIQLESELSEVFSCGGPFSTLWHYAFDEIEAGRLPWKSFGIRNSMEFWVIMNDWEVFYELLKIAPEHSARHAKKMLSQHAFATT